METRRPIEELYEKAIKRARYAGHKEVAEDFAAWITIKWLEGSAKHQTLGQSLIDFLRAEYGGTGIRRGGDALLRSHREKEYLWEDETNEEYLERVHSNSGYSWYCDREFASIERFHLPTTGFLTSRKEEIWKMYTASDSMTLRQIANEFDLTESRVSQILSSIKKDILRHKGFQMMKERVQNEASSFEIEWISF